MSNRAWVYIFAIFCGGLAIFAQSALTLHLAAADLLIFGVLLALATLAHLFKADVHGNAAFYATPVFFFAGIFLLPPFLFVLLIAVPHIVEWALERRKDTSGEHLKPWYIQPFNIAMTVITGTLVRALYRTVQPASSRYDTVSAVVAAAVAICSYVIINNILVGQALVLARGKSWRRLDIIKASNLVPECIMLCLGFVTVVLWELSPWLIVPALVPLVLMYQALAVPRLRQEAQTDAKTGLLNAGYFQKLSTEELTRAQRFQRPVAAIMADLDYLRDVNNTYGHLAGDVVLHGISQIIRRELRDYDLAGRFGGEEFAILLPEVEQAEAEDVANRLREAISNASFTVTTSTTPIQVTMSLGVACFPQDALNLAALLHEADVAVYQAKMNGRNRVVCAADIPEAVKREFPKVSPAPTATDLRDLPKASAPGRQGGRVAMPIAGSMDAPARNIPMPQDHLA